MKMFQIGLIGIAVIAVIGVSYNLFSLKGNLKKEVEDLRGKVTVLQEENASLIHDIEYYAIKENLLKEVKSQFNYRESGENIIIIVPAATSTE